MTTTMEQVVTQLQQELFSLRAQVKPALIKFRKELMVEPLATVELGLCSALFLIRSTAYCDTVIIFHHGSVALGGVCGARGE